MLCTIPGQAGGKAAIGAEQFHVQQEKDPSHQHLILCCGWLVDRSAARNNCVLHTVPHLTWVAGDFFTSQTTAGGSVQKALSHYPELETHQPLRWRWGISMLAYRSVLDRNPMLADALRSDRGAGKMCSMQSSNSLWLSLSTANWQQ